MRENVRENVERECRERARGERKREEERGARSLLLVRAAISPIIFLYSTSASSTCWTGRWIKVSVCASPTTKPRGHAGHGTCPRWVTQTEKRLRRRSTLAPDSRRTRSAGISPRDRGSDVRGGRQRDRRAPARRDVRGHHLRLHQTAAQQSRN